MKVLVLGAGNMGSVAAEDIAASMSTTEVTVADNSKARAQDVAKKIGRNNMSWTSLDVTNHKELAQALGDCDLVMGFLPGKLGRHLLEACLEARRNLVDVSFTAENPLAWNDEAKSADVTVVPDCGLAPGISNILVGHAVAKMSEVQAVHMMVGGLPEKPVPPLGYVVTWSPESLIDEYTRKARTVADGRRAEVEALSGLEEVEFPSVGKLEAFYTDGLRTLLYTVTGAHEMWEKTLRYPGHAEKVKLLRALGFFDDERITVDGVDVSPRKLTAKLLGEKLWNAEVKDIVALAVDVWGAEEGEKVHYAYHLLDRYDEKRKITSMARTTAFPASIIAQLLLKKVIKEKGVVPPEKLGMDEKVFELFLAELNKRGVKIREERLSG